MESNIKKYFTNIEEGCFITTTKDGDCYAITTTRPSRGLDKRLTNYVLETHFEEIEEGVFVTTDREKDNCYAITTRQRSRPLTKKQDNYILELEEMGVRLRKLTPVECERLQGFPDGWTEFGKDGEKISDTQRYKCCGNAVTTNVITAIVDEMFDEVKE